MASLDELNKEIENRKKVEESLREVLKAKSAFTAKMSHELITPLAAIKESINIVSDESAGKINQEQREFLTLAKRNADRLSRLISDILDFQILEEGKMIIKPEENDINIVIKEIWKTMGPLAEEKKLDIILDLEEGLPKINFDKLKIIRVLTGLIGNAIKVTEKGSIAIVAKRGDNFIQVSVKDTGQGIKEEDMPKLFKGFEQTETGTERRAGGTGLGLAISKGIIEIHKGKIWAESEFGKGSVFHFILPIKERRT